MTPEATELAREAYDAYHFEARGYGCSVVRWHELDTPHQQGWIAAARAIRESILLGVAAEIRSHL